MKTDPRFPKLHIVDHPLVQHKLSTMREKKTPSNSFRQLLRELTYLIGMITSFLPLMKLPLHLQSGVSIVRVSSGRSRVTSYPILRAGLGMSEGLLDLMPSARVGHIGLYRGPDHKPVEYLVKLPSKLEGRRVILCDPMLATGNSAVAAVNTLLKRGVKPKDITFVALVSAPEGVETFQKAHPEIELYVASLDEKLDKNAYILPGLGDAGDRIFGTK